MTTADHDNKQKQKQLRQLHRRFQKVPGGGKSRIQRRLAKKIKQNEGGAKNRGLVVFWYAEYRQNGIIEVEEKEGEGEGGGTWKTRTWKDRSCQGTFSSERTVVLRKKGTLSEMKRDVVKHGLAHKISGLSDIAGEVQLHTLSPFRYIGTDEEWLGLGSDECNILVHFPYVY